MVGKTKGIGVRGLRPNAEPNVIPFIDIMLCLLIIFMVAAPLPTVDLKVDLPRGAIHPSTDQDQSTMVRLVGADGGMMIYVQDELVAPDALGERLVAVAAERNPSQQGSLPGLLSQARIYIDADQGVAYANVVSLIDRVDEVGFQKVNLLVKDAET
jgi:biopolymer transport protein ExbD